MCFEDGVRPLKKIFLFLVDAASEVRATSKKWTAFSSYNVRVFIVKHIII
jgi:hypothetical protein